MSLPGGFLRAAADASDTLTTLKSCGVKIGILSDIHFDIRPAFAHLGLCELVDCVRSRDRSCDGACWLAIGARSAELAEQGGRV